MKSAFLYSLLMLTALRGSAQYAPQAGLPGSTAISAASSVFVEWATQCTVQRGFMDIANPSGGYASAGIDSFALGAADGAIVSLGDSGVGTVTFAHPIIDGPGADFAVFENGFRDIADSSLAFLELGFVEVSSDGVNFFRFPATSLTQTSTQIGNGNYTNASQLNNLAGSYVALYGTPFDLHELAGTAGLDVNNVTHVRIIDVIGKINGHSSYDNGGRIINDPYPTAFPTGGFDLDAVGVIHESANAGVVNVADNISVHVYPNPAFDNISIEIKDGEREGWQAAITSVTGNVLQRSALRGGVNTLRLDEYPAGMYFVVLQDQNGRKWTGKFTRR